MLDNGRPFPWRASVVSREPAPCSALDLEWLGYRVEDVLTAARNEYRVPIVTGPDVVAAVVHDRAAASLIMVRQIRPGPLLLADGDEQPDWPAEVVIGVLDPEREPGDMARQEIREETGAAVKRLERAGVVYLNPADSTRRAHVFYAETEHAPRSPPRPLGHEGETILSEYLPIDEIDEWVGRGRIADTLSLCALTLCRSFIVR